MEKKFSCYIILLMSSLNGIVYSEPLSFSKCALSDSACLSAQATAVVPTFTAGIPELGIERLENFIIEPIYEKNVAGVEYELKNCVVTGLKNFTVKNLSINSRIKLILLSSQGTIKVTCNFRTKGEMFALPITGTGKSTIIMKNMILDLLMPFSIIQDGNGKDIIDVQTYLYGVQYLDKVEYKVEFDGGKIELSKKLAEHYNSVWRIISRLYGKYMHEPIINKIFGAIKTFLSLSPLEDLVLY